MADLMQDGVAEPAIAAADTQAADESAPSGRFGELETLEDLMGALEALLFVSDAPVRVATFCEMTDAQPDAVALALETLQQRRRLDGSGIVLREVAGGWRLFTNPLYHHLVERYVVSWDTRKLSQAALETLAVVAYLQPVTRAQVASVRGVNSDSPISSLVEKGLVREVGVADAPGNPSLYGTTKTFLERFGLASAADLPSLELYAPDEETKRLIRERLSASGAEVSAGGEGQESRDLDSASAEESLAIMQEQLAPTIVSAADGEGEGDFAESPLFEDDPLAGFVFSEEDEGFEVFAGEGIPGSVLVEALASGFGLTDKVSAESVPAAIRDIFEEGSAAEGRADG